MTNRKVFVLFFLACFSLALASESLAGQYILRSARLKAQIEDIKDIVGEAEYEKDGEILYLKVHTLLPITIPEFCESVPLLKQNIKYAINRIREFNKISDVNLELRVFLVPIDAVDPSLEQPKF